MKNHTTLSIWLNRENFSAFTQLMQQGVMFETSEGTTINDLLCEQLMVDAGYLSRMIRTIFLNGKPVDDVKTATIKDGSIIALSPAMPGLVGATFSRGTVLSSLRSSITHKDETNAIQSGLPALVKIKLFNLIIKGLGPDFLKKGVWLEKDDIIPVIKKLMDISQSDIHEIQKDGKIITLEKLAEVSWIREPDLILFSVFIRSEP